MTLDEQQAGAAVRDEQAGDQELLPRMSIATAAASALTLATFAVYIALLSRQGTPLTNGRVLFIAGSIVILGVLTAWAALEREARTRLALLGVAVPGLVGIGFIGAWSIGLALLLAGILAAGAAVPAARASGLGARRIAVAGLILTIGVWGALYLGLVVTDTGGM
ncbi:MAG: hypothetical protein ACRDG7_15385 [Candidatus Limnocylindria bacterium]